VQVVLSEGNISALGRAAHHDTMVSSARAYVNALNKLIAKRRRAEGGVRASL
jgi:2-isopropylmalate synthase